LTLFIAKGCFNGNKIELLTSKFITMIYNQLSSDEKIKAIAEIAVVMGEYFSKYLDDYNRKISNSYEITVEILAQFSFEFFNENIDVNWSDGNSVWKDEVYNYGHLRVVQYIECN
jgi:hypothetical protein